jgi:hypothetical protein
MWRNTEALRAVRSRTLSEDSLSATGADPTDRSRSSRPIARKRGRVHLSLLYDSARAILHVTVLEARCVHGQSAQSLPNPCQAHATPLWGCGPLP